MGLYPDAPKPPFIPGFEASGIVVDGGQSQFRPGDRVVGLKLFGAQTSRLAIDAEAVFKIPDSLNFEEAAAVPVNYITAYHVLSDLARVRAGESVLIHSAAGGVGTAACQLALNAGAYVIGIGGGPAKTKHLRSLGVQEIVDRSAVEFSMEIKRRYPKGIDIILDPVGGRTTRANLKLLGPGGRLVACGVSALAHYGKANIFQLLWDIVTFPRVRMVDLMQSNKSVFGVNLSRMLSRKKELGDILLKLLEMSAKKTIKPYIDKTYQPDDIAEAHRYLQSGASLGKLLINWS
jgi:NADPH:quinone reductase-like Zn-dependent oxidoreductase